MDSEEEFEDFETDVDENNKVSDNVDKKQTKNISEKKRESFFVKILKVLSSFIVTLIVMIVIAGLILNFKYQINAFSFIGQVSKINSEVDVTAITDNAFTDADLQSINGKLSADSIIEESLLSGAIVFTDREIASYVDDKIRNDSDDNQTEETETEGEEVAEKVNQESEQDELANNLNFRLISIEFLSTTKSEHLTDLKVVFGVNLKNIKEKKMSRFPANLLKNIVPDDLYISATVEIVKNSDDDLQYEYGVVAKSMTLNNLNDVETSKFLNAINTFVNFGGWEKVCEDICIKFADAIIGNSENNGFYYSLKKFGAKSYMFYHGEEENDFVVGNRPADTVATIYYNNTKNSENLNPNSYTMTDGKIVLLPLSSKGYNFIGWYDGVLDISEKIEVITAWNLENFNLYAKWEIIRYDISYDLQGGTAVNPNSYTIEDTFTLSKPVKDILSLGLTPFVGWTGSNGDEMQAEVTISAGTTGNLNFVAWYYEDRNLSLYVDNHKFADINVKVSETIEKYMDEQFIPSELGMSGYYVENWFEDEEMKHVYDESKIVLDDFSLYSTWSYIVDTPLSFYPYISKFENAVKHGEFTAYSHKELSAYIGYMYFYDIKTKVTITLNYSFSGSVKKEVELAGQEATDTSLFYSGSVYTYIPDDNFAVKKVKNIQITESHWSEYATLVMDPNKEYIYEQKANALELNYSPVREDDFDDFKINNVQKTLNVSNTWQLAYCLEQGYRPVCIEGSSAERIYNKAKAVLRNICDDSMSDIQKIRAIYEWLIKNVSYDYKALEQSQILANKELRKYNSWYAEGVFDDGVSVCEGYAKAFVILSKIENIPAIYVSGNEHAWNKVYVENSWQGVDATHGDGSVNSGNSYYEMPNYQNLFFTDEYKTSLGFTSTYFTDEKYSANQVLDYFSNVEFKYGTKTFDLYVQNLSELDTIIAYAKKYANDNNFTSYVFQFEFSKNIELDKVDTKIYTLAHTNARVLSDAYDGNKYYTCIVAN